MTDHEWWHVIDLPDGTSTPGGWDLRRTAAQSIPWPELAGKRCLDVGTAPLSLLPSPLARLDARRDGREWFVFNRPGLRKVVELAGWTIDAQTGILADRPGPLPAAQGAHRNWKWRIGVRGRSCAILAS